MVNAFLQGRDLDPDRRECSLFEFNSADLGRVKLRPEPSQVLEALSN